MKLCGKYHGSGRLYTADELEEREAYNIPLYVVPGYRVSKTINPLTGMKDRMPALVLPYRNEKNRRM